MLGRLSRFTDAPLQLAGMEVAGQRVWTVHSGDLPGTGLVAVPAQTPPLPPLPPHAHARRRQEQAAGRTCAAVALRRAGWTGSLSLGRGPGGAPTWPPGFSGSLAHSGALALAVTGPNTLALGLDLEERSPLLSGPALLRHVLRESAFKAAFPTAQMPFDPAAFAVTVLTPDRAELTLTRTLAPGWTRGQRLQAVWAQTTGHLAALTCQPLHPLFQDPVSQELP
ncbi:hypothetical protein K7W42_04570 [Deinococcus sp. HMF7604]|uniref:4'-phosphopantetheinyl transferase family protein n=1 Tax=Deinococcus betulae TaxID=2873312 RepID=UPI001CCC985E|nr:hypothetical protein [Deinococcus betulae]MBZ9750134.1 hypothetical protein [Deinococcus betulae]